VAKGQQTTASFPLSASTEQDQAKSVGLPSKATPAGDEIFHVAIFRFAKEHVKDAMAAFRELASATRGESGNLRYDIYPGIDDDQEFYVRRTLGLAGSSGRTTNALRHLSTSVRVYS
jgi:hypothetical protein